MGALRTSTIASGASNGSGVACGGQAPAGFYMPAAWTAATVGFDGSNDGGTTWFPICDGITNFAGTEIAYTVVAAKYYGLNPSMFAGVNYIRARSGTAAAAVTQDASRAISIVAIDL